jgi:hypothetical protein
VHFNTPQGPRSSIKVFQYINEPRIDFTLKVLGKSIKQQDLETLFSYGGVHGYAGERGDGEGKYQFTIEPVVEA